MFVKDEHPEERLPVTNPHHVKAPAGDLPAALVVPASAPIFPEPDKLDEHLPILPERAGCIFMNSLFKYRYYAIYWNNTSLIWLMQLYGTVTLLSSAR